MLDEILDGRPDLAVTSGIHDEPDGFTCWHKCEKNGQTFVFGLDVHGPESKYYLDRDGARVAEGSKSSLLSGLERYGILNELDAKLTQRIFMDLRC